MRYHRCLQKMLEKHMSSVLTGMAITGVVATAIFSAKCTPKALDLLEKAREEKSGELSTLEKVTTVLPAYTPVILAGSCTIACIIGANYISNKKIIALTSAYLLRDRTLQEYKDELEPEIIEDIEKKRRKKRYEELDGIEKSKHSNGDELFYEEFSGRYFISTLNDVLTAEYYMNQTFSERGYVYLNDFYLYLGIELTPIGNSVGWSCDDFAENGNPFWIEFINRDLSDVDGTSCTMIEYPINPTPTFLDKWITWD